MRQLGYAFQSGGRTVVVLGGNCWLNNITHLESYLNWVVISCTYSGQYSIVSLLCELVTLLAVLLCSEWKVGMMEGIGRGNERLK